MNDFRINPGFELHCVSDFYPQILTSLSTKSMSKHNYWWIEGEPDNKSSQPAAKGPKQSPNSITIY